jgi:hypothetical protein
MRMWPILAVTLATTGCYESQQLSLQPLFGDEQAVDLPGIVGSWVADGDKEDEVLTFAREEGKVYSLSFVGSNGQRQNGLLVAFGAVGDGEPLYWDLTALPYKDEPDVWAEHHLPVHSFARVKLDGDRLDIAYFQRDWLKKALRESSVEIAYTVVDDTNVVLTATPAELRQLLCDHGDDEGAFGAPQVYHRRPAAE